MPVKLKTKREYKSQLKNLIKEYSKIDDRINNLKINVTRYCTPTEVAYRNHINFKIMHYSKHLECKLRYQRTDRWRECARLRMKRFKERNPERYKENMDRAKKKYRATHPEYSRLSFQRWTINNPRKAMMSAAAAHMAIAVINRLWIRPTVCPHCGKEHCLIDFHHPNHLFWWKWTFCCKSCHYYFNRDKVPASDTIIDLKKLLRESLSH